MGAASSERHADEKTEDSRDGDGKQTVEGAVTAGKRTEKRGHTFHPDERCARVSQFSFPQSRRPLRSVCRRHRGCLRFSRRRGVQKRPRPLAYSLEIKIPVMYASRDRGCALCI